MRQSSIVEILDYSFPSPQENLACDEAILEACENGEIQSEVLRFWESWQYFVALGYTGKVLEETDVRECQKLGIPVLRRTSGGGTVLQGPGCLNYGLVLRIEGSSVAGITQTNRFVMERNAQALTEVLRRLVALQGHTDLTLDNKKFSGNAQRRKQKFLLFHGTFLLDFDLPLIPQALRSPPVQPAYRAGRAHQDFVTNLNVPHEAVKAALIEAWQGNGVLPPPLTRMEKLIREKYARDEWNLRF